MAKKEEEEITTAAAASNKNARAVCLRSIAEPHGGRSGRGPIEGF